MDNRQAKNILDQFNYICEMYNKNEFDEKPKYLLQVLQTQTIEAFDLWRFLKSKEPESEAARAYCIFAGKILLRLSYLIHEGRRETEQEARKYWKGFKL